jgi:hypothetical protein
LKYDDDRNELSEERMNCQHRVERIAEQEQAAGIDRRLGLARAILKTDINPGW